MTELRKLDVTNRTDIVLLMRFLSSYRDEAIIVNSRFSQPSDASLRFYNLRQTLEEDITDFYERFRINLAMAIQSRSELGLENLTESQIAYIFRMQLHPKNQSYFAETNPEVVENRNSYSSAQEVIDQVYEYYMRKGQGGKPAVKNPTMFYTVDVPHAPAGKKWTLVDTKDSSKESKKKTGETSTKETKTFATDSDNNQEI